MHLPAYTIEFDLLTAKVAARATSAQHAQRGNSRRSHHVCHLVTGRGRVLCNLHTSRVVNNEVEETRSGGRIILREQEGEQRKRETERGTPKRKENM